MLGWSQGSAARAGHAAHAPGSAQRRTATAGWPALAGILRRLAVLLAALAVCATVAGTWQAWAAAAAVDAAASAGALDTSERVRLLGSDHDAPPPDLEAAVLEDEHGEDEDLAAGVAATTARSFVLLAAPLEASLGWPEDPSFAASHAAAGAALPRGPPALRA